MLVREAFGVVVLCSVFGGCGRTPRVDAGPVHDESRTAAGSGSRFPLRMHYTYVDDEDDHGKRRTSTWEVACVRAPDSSADEQAFDCSTKDLSGVDKPTSRRVAVRAEGLLQLSMTVGTRTTSFEPPRMLLPSHPSPGFAWKREQQIGAMTVREESKIVAATGCEGAVVVDEVSTYSSGAKLTSKTRFCPGVGIVEEVLDMFEGGAVVAHSDQHDFVDLR